VGSLPVLELSFESGETSWVEKSFVVDDRSDEGRVDNVL
jgi:hypothetical protein